jgi:HEAT repeat protein
MRYLLAVVLIACPEALASQSLASRVASARDGAVVFHYSARPGVCGDGEHFVRTGDRSYHGSWSSGRDMEPCVMGPVQVRLTLENGAVNRVQYWVGPIRDRAARDLGRVPAPEAARFLVDVAERGGHRASGNAIFPAVLADSAVVWPALLGIAKDRDTRIRATRRDALFWLSRFAAGALAGEANNPFVEDHDSLSDDAELKRHAVFVLSQLPRGEGVTQLIEVSRSKMDWRVRSHALFWLGQSGDERAVDVFEAILRSSR